MCVCPGNQFQDLIHVRQELCHWTTTPPQPSNFKSFLKLLFIYVLKGWSHSHAVTECGGQKRACRSWVSFTVWIPEIKLGVCSSFLSVGVINTTTKSSFFSLQFRDLSNLWGTSAQGLKQKPWKNTTYWFLTGSRSSGSFTVQGYLPRDGIAHDGLHPPTSIINEDNVSQIWHRSDLGTSSGGVLSLPVTLGLVQFTIRTNQITHWVISPAPLEILSW